MDGDIGTFIQSVLSDPEQMAKITQMAQGIMQQPEQALPAAAAEEDRPSAEPADSRSAGQTPAFSPGEMKLFSALTKAFSAGGGKSRSTELLLAMRPYMKAEKREKLDRAMKIARMAHIAGTVMKEYGGG